MNETLEEGKVIDTTLSIHPDDFRMRLTIVETMSLKELDEFIKKQLMQGETNVKTYQIERQNRIAFPFSMFILTFIGVAVSSRKMRGGIGLQIAIGVVISFSFILFYLIAYSLACANDPDVIPYPFHYILLHWFITARSAAVRAPSR